MAKNFGSNGDLETIMTEAASHIKKRLETVQALPPASSRLLGKAFLLVNDQESYIKGVIYQCVEQTENVYIWDAISFCADDLPNYEHIITESKSSWDSRTAEDKETYTIVNITDDNPNVVVSDNVADGDMNPVTSNAVYDALKGHVKFLQKRLSYDDLIIESTVYGGLSVAKVSSFYEKCELSESNNLIINVIPNNNTGSVDLPIIIRDSSESNYIPFHTIGISTTDDSIFQNNNFVELKVIYI